MTSLGVRQSHLEPHHRQANVTIFNSENGQIGETSVRHRVEAQTVEERTQQRLEPADKSLSTGC